MRGRDREKRESVRGKHKDRHGRRHGHRHRPLHTDTHGARARKRASETDRQTDRLRKRECVRVVYDLHQGQSCGIGCDCCPPDFLSPPNKTMYICVCVCVCVFVCVCVYWCVCEYARSLALSFLFTHASHLTPWQVE